MQRLRLISHIALPTGTSAGSVVEPRAVANPTLEARRFGHLSALEPASRRDAFATLVRDGVFVIRRDTLILIRRSRAGERVLFAIIAASGSDPSAATDGSGIDPALSFAAIESPSGALRAAVDAETKQRPIFHGVASDGTTYTGFECADPGAVLASLEAEAGLAVTPTAAGGRAAPLWAVAIGPPGVQPGVQPGVHEPPLPPGLAVRVDPAIHAGS